MMFSTTSSFLPHFPLFFAVFTNKHYFVVTLSFISKLQLDRSCDSGPFSRKTAYFTPIFMFFAVRLILFFPMAVRACYPEQAFAVFEVSSMPRLQGPVFCVYPLLFMEKDSAG